MWTDVDIIRAACLFSAESRKTCSASSANFSPNRGPFTVGGRVGASDVDSQVLFLAGLEVIQWQVPPGSQFSPSGLVGVGPHIGVVYINEGIGVILI